MELIVLQCIYHWGVFDNTDEGHLATLSTIHITADSTLSHTGVITNLCLDDVELGISSKDM